MAPLGKYKVSIKTYDIVLDLLEFPGAYHAQNIIHT